MKQRLAIAATLLKDPDLLIFDEPTNGLDPAGIHEIRSMMRNLARRGKTVLVSSHILSEVQQIADTVTIIGRGRLLAEGNVSQILSADGQLSARVGVSDHLRAAEVLTRSGFTVEPLAGRLLKVSLSNQQLDLAVITRLLADQGLYVSELTPIQPDLESVFLNLTAGEHLGAQQQRRHKSQQRPLEPQRERAQTASSAPASAGAADGAGGNDPAGRCRDRQTAQPAVHSYALSVAARAGAYPGRQPTPSRRQPGTIAAAPRDTRDRGAGTITDRAGTAGIRAVGQKSASSARADYGSDYPARSAASGAAKPRSVGRCALAERGADSSSARASDGRQRLPCAIRRERSEQSKPLIGPCPDERVSRHVLRCEQARKAAATPRDLPRAERAIKPRFARRCPGRARQQTRSSSASKRGGSGYPARSAASGASNQTPDRAPLSWTSEASDTFFVCEQARKAAATPRDPPRASEQSNPGSRAVVLDERGSRHVLRLRASEEGSGYPARSAASGASNQTPDRAPLSWTSEAADTFFVCEQARKAAATPRDPPRAERAIKHSRLTR